VKTEGLFLVEIKDSKTGKEVIKTITDIEIPDTLNEMFADSENIVAKLGERVQQIYFTVGRVKPNGSKRPGLDQQQIMFDFDYVIQDRKEEYVKLFCEHFKLDREKTGIVDSGYGLQFHVMFKTPAVEKDFNECDGFFRTQVRLMELKMQDSGLIDEFIIGGKKQITHIDSSVFRLASLARFPNTINHAPKKERELRRTKLIQGKVEPQADSLKALLQIDLDEELGETKNIRTLKIDTEFVKQNCGLLQFALNNPADLHEKDFFLVVGLLKHCAKTEADGEALCLEFFRELKRVTKSPTLGGYSEKKALEKIIRAKPASYKKIDLHGDWCKNDPGRPRNQHPLQMRSPNFIATQDSGFHRVKENKNGQFTYQPEFEDLRRFFELQHSYISCNEVCWIFNGKFYERFEKDFLKNFAQEHFNPTADTSMVSEFTNLVLRTNLIRPADWEKNTERKTCFNNGVLDIDSGVFTPHDDKKTTKQFLFRSCVPYDYDPQATAPLFDKFMDDVVRGIPEFKQNALEYFGYAIAGEPIWLAQTLLLLGPDGAGGKSTTLDTVKKVVGSGLYSTLSLEDLNDPQARAMLEGKYFNVFGETESSKYMQSKVWKALTTGEEVTIKNVFEKPYSIKSRAKMMFASNHVPKSNDTSDAFFRRWLVIPFTRNFIEEGVVDSFIGKKLEAELPGIFNMLVNAYKRLKARGSFEIGPESRKVFEEFKNEVDPVRGWFYECVEDQGTGEEARASFVSSSDLFANFHQYCRDQNLEFGGKIVTGKAFALKIQKMFKNPKIDRQIRRSGGSGDSKRGYWGLRTKLEN
jgi:putative DNA primase/helicase